MPLAVDHSRSLDACHAPEVTVEVHLANGLPSFTLVGLADTEVKEARERVRAALQTSGLEFPHNRRVTVNLAPADLPKESGRFDLPIAVGILAASGQVPQERLNDHEFAGELALTGELRAVRGVLAMVLSARHDRRAFVLPEVSAAEASLVRDATVLPASSLLAVCAHLTGASPLTPLAGGAAQAAVDAPMELADIRGQARGKRVLEIA